MTFVLLLCGLVVASEFVGCMADCSADVKSACTVTTVQNLGYRVQRRALSKGAHVVIGEINNPLSSVGKLSNGFHAVIFNFNNVCVAHGAQPSNVGKSLKQIMEGSGIISTPNLGQLFQGAAMSGGEWVSYPWSGSHWRRSWVLGFPALGSTLPIPSPSGLMGSDIVVPDDKSLKITWDSAYPPPWSNLSKSVDPAKAYYVEVGYMNVDKMSSTCDANGASGVFESCQHENAYNLVQHAKEKLLSSPTAAFEETVKQLSQKSFKIKDNFYVTMIAASSGKCVMDGESPGNIGKTLQDIMKSIGHLKSTMLHAAMRNASLTKHGRWVLHPWPSTVSKTRAGVDVPHFVNRFSFVVGLAGRPNTVYNDLEGYYLFAGFSDPEHHMLGASFLDSPYCKASSRTGCSITTAQNLVFQAHDELDSAADPSSVWTKVNTDTIFPKKYNSIHHWQGYLQKPLGFYVFAYNASDALLLAQGAIPVAAPPVTPGRTIYGVQRALGVVSHPRLREVYSGIVFIAKGGWLTYQWSNQRIAGKPAPRKRTYMMPWRPQGSLGPFQFYFGVGYDDVHPKDVAKPCYASEFGTCSEENSYNLAHVIQTDILSLGTGSVTVEGKEVLTIEDLLKKISTSSFYQLSTGFYPFVFAFGGNCVAHGRDPESVGLTLPQMMAKRSIEGVPANLHEQFKDAAERGGEWVSYPWKDTPKAESELKMKYSFVLPATHMGVKYYVGVGFQSGAALPWQPPTTISPPSPSPSESQTPLGSLGYVLLIVVACIFIVFLGICGCTAIYFKRDRDRLALNSPGSAHGNVIGSRT